MIIYNMIIKSLVEVFKLYVMNSRGVANIGQEKCGTEEKKINIIIL